MATYGVYEHSHWQGSGPDSLLYVGSREQCDAYVALMASCSFCGGGRGGYSVGRCLVVRRPRYVSADVPVLPESIEEWDAADVHAWERDAEEAY